LKLDKIGIWAEKFGLNALISIPSSNQRIGLQFYDKITNLNIDISEGGLGIGQLIFLIVECILAEPGTVLLIDEPETHLHAKFQALVMDLIIETINRGIQVIVATHSEYFILRLQKRIAEGKVKHTDVIVIETLRSLNNDFSITKHKFSEKGNYEKNSPQVIEFAKQEFFEWSKFLNEKVK